MSPASGVGTKLPRFRTTDLVLYRTFISHCHGGTQLANLVESKTHEFKSHPRHRVYFIKKKKKRYCDGQTIPHTLSRSSVYPGLEVPQWSPLWFDAGAAGAEVKSSQFPISRWLQLSLLADGMGYRDLGSILVGRYLTPERLRGYTEKRSRGADLFGSLCL